MKESKFQFSNPVLNDLKFHVNEDFDSDSFEGFNEISLTNSTKKNKEKREAIVSITFSCGQKEKNVPMTLSIEMSADFTWSEEIENYEDFLEVNAPSLIFSYARPIIAMITNSSKLPVFNVPFVDFTKKS